MRSIANPIGVAVIAPAPRAPHLIDSRESEEGFSGNSPQPPRHLRLLPQLCEASPRQTRASLVIVDHDMVAREMLASFLRWRGYRVWAATSAIGALALIAQQKLDLVVTELVLPGMSGVELVRVLRRQRSTTLVPIIVLSAIATPRDICNGLALGADDFIAKPAELGVVEARVAALLRRDARLRQAQTSLALEDAPQPAAVFSHLE
jgi:two-component system sensor histidine kinase ChiS